MIKEATLREAKETANLALLLWAGHKFEEFIQEIENLISRPDSQIFLAYHGNEAIGFAQCQLRYDYVEGISSSPVGYLEGLFVKEEFRKQGFARKLVNACETWTKNKGCREFASNSSVDIYSKRDITT